MSAKRKARTDRVSEVAISEIASPPITPLPFTPLLLTIAEAARMLSASEWAIRALLWAKEIPFIKVGRRHLIDPADLRAFIERKKMAA